MAQGSQTRMRGHIDGPKQLLRLGRGTSILGRTVSLLRQSGIHDILVVACSSPAWARFCETYGVALLSLDEPGDTLLDGIYRVRKHWSETAANMFIMADVIFSRRCSKLLIAPTNWYFVGRIGPNELTGRPWDELFAFACASNRVADLRSLLRKPSVRRRQCSATGFGKLWSLYQLIKETEPRRLKFSDPKDFTDDIDTPDDLKMLPILARAVAKEAQRETTC
ncbi:NTP transferase domain-containing protein [Reyranella sp. MMS21-HV4-11]|uniref:NTP transferase domain-containing protein n=1 Tax=Reyranella humidisoli TaxID=2849149 RepID=A0ABS6IGL0_9HYPH|nr:NTP transferase domain-containing protein [Reyranella sp. MMS21-HV4-11]MBU8873714.1 NTP transferase domain-containing protein [Reyranella sp. MMS21-HV4-11]